MTDTSTGSSLQCVVLVVCAVVLAMLSLASVSEARPRLLSTRSFRFGDDDFDDASQLFRARRTPGFKQGSIDRVGHQFGKRSGLDELLAPPEQTAEFIMTDEYVAGALTKNPRLALLFVRRYIDINGDGLITPEELQVFFESD